MAQPLMTGAMMWTKISITLYTSSLRQLDAWGIGDFIIISPVSCYAYVLKNGFQILDSSLIGNDNKEDNDTVGIW